MALTADRLRAVLDYDPLTGAFIWRERISIRITVGKRAGVANRLGHVCIGVDGVKHYAHRLAWLYMTGAWPAESIDHINGDPGDNRFANLRDVPHRTNMQNIRKRRSNNRSGFLGVVRDKDGGRWRATLKSANGESVLSLGSFSTAEEAHAAYLEAKRRLHPGCTI
jgi:hypothetical protein